MSGRSPAGPLIKEHRVIERLIGVLRVELASMETGRADPRAIDRITDFIRTYADRCHHGKEEDILFRRLAAKDLEPQIAEEMQGLIEDHVRARALTRGLVEANERYATGDDSALAQIKNAMVGLVELYPAHIAREDRHFFKPSVGYLSAEERARMLLDFAEFDRELIHEKYGLVVAALESRRNAPDHEPR